MEEEDGKKNVVTLSTLGLQLAWRAASSPLITRLTNNHLVVRPIDPVLSSIHVTSAILAPSKHTSQSLESIYIVFYTYYMFLVKEVHLMLQCSRAFSRDHYQIKIFLIVARTNAY